jgi:hypothetical protein
MKAKYTCVKTDHGQVLLVQPADFARMANSTSYHLYPYGAGRRIDLVQVPVIYLEGGRLFTHELWPFKLADVAEAFGEAALEITTVCAVPNNHLQHLFSKGYASFMAAKIRGEL